MAAPTQAKVTSTEALDQFRSAMIIWVAKAKRSLDDMTDNVRRTKQWVQHDQRVHYEGELRRRRKALEQAERELMSARLANTSQAALINRQMALSKAQRDIQDTEGKMRKLKSWSQNFDAAADPTIKRMDKLRHTLAEHTKAIAYLMAIQKALESYAESKRPAGEVGDDIASMAKELNIDFDLEVDPATAAEITEATDAVVSSSDMEPLPQIEPPPGPGASPA